MLSLIELINSFLFFSDEASKQSYINYDANFSVGQCFLQRFNNTWTVRILLATAIVIPVLIVTY